MSFIIYNNIDLNLLWLLLYFWVSITMLAINAIKESEEVQHPELFYSEQDDRVSSLKIEVEQEGLRSCQV